jgi:hypothetical protein
VGISLLKKTSQVATRDRQPGVAARLEQSLRSFKVGIDASSISKVASQ